MIVKDSVCGVSVPGLRLESGRVATGLFSAEPELRPWHGYLEEFVKQLNRLLQLGYPRAAGVSDEEFVYWCNLLQLDILQISSVPDCNIPLVLVIPGHLVPYRWQLGQVKINGKTGRSIYSTRGPNAFRGYPCPNAPYLIANVDSNYRPRRLEDLKKPQREKAGLTVDEGVALATHFPEVFQQGSMFLLGSHDGVCTVEKFWNFQSDEMAFVTLDWSKDSIGPDYPLHNSSSWARSYRSGICEGRLGI